MSLLTSRQRKNLIAILVAKTTYTEKQLSSMDDLVLVQLATNVGITVDYPKE